MWADLWIDLADPDTPRGHPLLAAALYLFCPAAARWWLAGADPLAPFDPLREAHVQRSSGRTLRVVLEELGLGSLVGQARKYVEQVEAFRERPEHRHVRAPELLPTFLGGKLSVATRHGLQEALERIGGWTNFYPFVRAWAFSLRDWGAELGWSGIPQLEQVEIECGSSIAGPVRLSAWRLTGSGHAFAAQLVSERERPAAPEGLIDLVLAQSAALDDHRLLTDCGRVLRSVGGIGVNSGVQAIDRAAALAETGPWLPVNALSSPVRCHRCGYRHICWVPGENRLTPVAMDF